MTYSSISHNNNWSYPTAIRFGAGRIREIPEVLEGLAVSRPLLVTDPGIASFDFIEQTLSLCQSKLEHCALFCDLQANPIEANVNDGVTAYKAGRHDGVIAFGGGSALDVGKAIALMIGQNRPIWDFEDRFDWYLRANAEAIAPVVAIPTTSGTGSEVGRASVITDGADDTKKIIFHPNMMPKVVILDPEVTIGLPSHITAGVGMDALSHNLEAFCSPVFHPLAQGIALEGIRLIKDWLPLACRDGTNLEARAQMQVASSMGATAFQKGLGAMHSLSHPCGSILGTHHGTTNAVVMPYVLEYNVQKIEEKLTTLANFLGLPGPSSQAVVQWVVDLKQEIGIPTNLADLGVNTSHVTEFSKMAVLDPSTSTNPRTMDHGNFEELYEICINGTTQLR